MHPSKFSINGVYPNPFNPSTNISFSIPLSSNVKIDIYDIKGNNITNLTNRNYSAGHYNIIWDASMHSSGIYFVKMISNDFIETKKIMLVK